VSNWRSHGTLSDALADNKVVGISGVDTRALTRHLRDRGAMRMGIFTGQDSQRPVDELLMLVKESPVMTGASFTDQVSTHQPYTVEPLGDIQATCVAVDLGIKSMTPQRMAERGIRVHVVPASSTWADIQALQPDGIFLSNGPGDPATAIHSVELVQSALADKVPVFGICFGNQILGRAIGLDTYKLQYGHRGINQPVMDLTTGKVEITAHNHGFAVKAPDSPVFDTPYGKARVTHVCLNDNVVEGLELLDVPAFSVQYHPEAAAGPHDSAYLFDRFLEMMRAHA
jgi:carbamoyl-phosphate synthase small subunit